MVQKLTSSSRVRAVMSRVSVVAGATIDGDLGDSNLGIALRCLGSTVFSLSTLRMYCPPYIHLIRTNHGFLWLCCGAFYFQVQSTPQRLHDINRHTLLQTRWLISLLDSNIQVQSVSAACFGHSDTNHSQVYTALQYWKSKRTTLIIPSWRGVVIRGEIRHASDRSPSWLQTLQ